MTGWNDDQDAYAIYSQDDDPLTGPMGREAAEASMRVARTYGEVDEDAYVGPASWDDDGYAGPEGWR